MNSEALQVMDLTSLKAVLADLREQIIPSRFEKSQQLEQSTIQLGFRTLESMIWLEVSWLADAPRVVQVPSVLALKGESTLARQLKYGLGQMALVELKQCGFERVVEFCFAQRPGGTIEKSLVIELMGRHSNIFLLDQKRRIVTLGRQVRDNQSRIRPIGTGDLYKPPPSLKGIQPCSQDTFELWKKRLCILPIKLKNALQDSFQGISPSLAMQLAHEEKESAEILLDSVVQELSQENWIILYKRWSSWLDQLENGKLSLVFDGPTDYRVWSPSGKINFASHDLSIDLGSYYRDKLDIRKINKISIEIRQILTKRLNSEKNLLLNQEKLLLLTKDHQLLKHQADLILASSSLKKIDIKNAQNLYDKAKKQRRSQPLIKERISHHKEIIGSIELSGVFLESILQNGSRNNQDKFACLTEIREEIEELFILSKRNLKKSKRKRNDSPSPLEVASPGGLLIQVGRNHRQNDWISIRSSRSGDLWFHAQECPGSHVVLKASEGQPEDADIQLAADLAVLFSRAKGNSKASVVIVAIDNLRRIPGTIPGTVNYKNAKVCWAQPSRAAQYLLSSYEKTVKNRDGRPPR